MERVSSLTRELRQKLSQWHERYTDWLMNAALPLWWEKGADHEQGGFHELLGMDGEPVLTDRRARVQGRQSYVYAVAGHLGWDGPWAEGAVQGLYYLAKHYRRPSGLFCTKVTKDGAVADPAEMLYDQAFALMASAWVFRMMPGRTEFKKFGHDLLMRVGRRRHFAGGFKETGDNPYLSNPHMHLFEAALAWHDTDNAPDWYSLAEELSGLCLGYFIDDNSLVLHEYFDENWEIATGEKGTSLEPGHQFEWAWLLERWSRIADSANAYRMARRLFEVGASGVDKIRNVAVDEMDLSFAFRQPTARLWMQTERLKASLILADTETETDKFYYLSEALLAAEILWKYLETPIPGLWHDVMLADGSFADQPAPASSFYHIICAIMCLREAVQK
jgi:mannose/cellobiose epimerase-like protein (N-acyl-D-glucosamine 2-epimerase family)